MQEDFEFEASTELHSETILKNEQEEKRKWFFMLVNFIASFLFFENRGELLKLYKTPGDFVIKHSVRRGIR